MTIFVTVLICLLLTGRFTARTANELDRVASDDKIEARFSRGRILEQTAVGRTVSQERQTWITECSEALLGAYLDIEEGDLLRNLTTQNISLCCEACQEMEACTSWRRNRSNDSCELFNVTRAVFAEESLSPFDIGGLIGRDLYASATITRRLSPYPACRIDQRRAYPNGTVLARGRTPSTQHCCEVCHNSSDCNSWHFNNRRRRCTLNLDIPLAINSSTFRGGTIFD